MAASSIFFAFFKGGIDSSRSYTTEEMVGAGDTGREYAGVASPATEGGCEVISASSSGARPNFFLGPGFLRPALGVAETLSGVGSRVCLPLPLLLGPGTLSVRGASTIDLSKSSATLAASLSILRFLCAGPPESPFLGISRSLPESDSAEGTRRLAASLPFPLGLTLLGTDNESSRTWPTSSYTERSSSSAASSASSLRRLSSLRRPCSSRS